MVNHAEKRRVTAKSLLLIVQTAFSHTQCYYCFEHYIVIVSCFLGVTTTIYIHIVLNPNLFEREKKPICSLKSRYLKIS